MSAPSRIETRSAPRAPGGKVDEIRLRGAHGRITTWILQTRLSELQAALPRCKEMLWEA